MPLASGQASRGGRSDREERVKELLRTNDVVLLSWAEAVLGDAGIDAVVLDTHMSVLDGSISAIPRRLMVADDDHAAAEALLRAAGEGVSDGTGVAPSTGDRLLGGRVVFHQPASGYRAAIDPVLLAAAIPSGLRGRAADLGCGAGAAALCLAARLPAVEVLGIERDPDLAALAVRNAQENGMADRLRVVRADLDQLPRELDGSFDAVLANPPYLEPARANAPADPGLAAATIEGEAGLALWLDVALRLARPKALLAFIHRADRLADLLALLRGRAGGIVVFPFWPKPNVAAKRVVVRARKGTRTPLVLAAGLVLHEPGGGYTPAADAVLRDGQGLAI